jgi:hypothetical protein
MTHATRLFTIAAVLLSATPVAQAQNSYTWTGTEATLGTRLFRSGTPSVAGTPKAFPGTQLETVSFTTFSFLNSSAVTQTFTAAVLGVSTGSNVFFSLYQGTFNPANLSLNYLGDAGLSCASATCNNTSFGVDVAGGTSVVLVANSINRAATAGESFTWQGPSAVFLAPTTTVPEPSTYLLMAAGLSGLFALRRRRAA